MRWLFLKINAISKTEIYNKISAICNNNLNVLISLVGIISFWSMSLKLWVTISNCISEMHFYSGSKSELYKRVVWLMDY